MPEDRCLVPQLTVEENIMLPLWVAGHLDRKARLDFVYEVIGELTEMRQRKALLLSGGQQKLVALGRALAIGTNACCSTSRSKASRQRCRNGCRRCLHPSRARI